MPATKHIGFCIPTDKKVVSAGPDCIHEVKCDGYRMRLERDGDRVQLFSKGGHDWTSRYPWIVETARKIRLCLPQIKSGHIGDAVRPGSDER
jgi:ATP-dependent DNA ligase